MIPVDSYILDKKRLPVGFPGVDDFRVHNVVQESLVVQEVKHVLNGQRQHGAAVGGAEDPLKQIIHILL